MSDARKLLERLDPEHLRSGAESWESIAKTVYEDRNLRKYLADNIRDFDFRIQDNLESIRDYMTFRLAQLGAPGLRRAISSYVKSSENSVL